VRFRVPGHTLVHLKRFHPITTRVPQHNQRVDVQMWSHLELIRISSHEILELGSEVKNLVVLPLEVAVCLTAAVFPSL
jgi:hypothetical protein